MKAGELLLTVITAVTFPTHVSGADMQSTNMSQVSASREQSDQWILDTSFGFPIQIAYSSALKIQQYSDQVIFLFIEDRYCSPDHLRTVCTGLAGRYLEVDSIEIDVYSDPVMLRRAIARYKKYPDDMTFPDTPEGIALEITIRGDTYIPKTGWARARYFKGPRRGERFFYKKDPQKIQMTEDVLKPNPVPVYTGNLQADLLLACQLNDFSKAKELIRGGARVDYKNELGETPLVNAVGHNNLEIVKLLLLHGAYVDAKNKYGQTLLNEALSHRFYEIVSLLLEHKADVNARYGTGISPLHLAAYGGDADIVEALLSKGADSNAADSDGNTPLFAAIRTRQTRIVRALLAGGASFKVRNKRGQTPRLLAKEIGDQAIVALLK